jgi:hypothetical protein
MSSFNLYYFGVYRCLTSLRLCWRYLRLSSLVSMASTLASNPAICSGIFSRSCTASSACPPSVVRGWRVVVMSEKGVVPRLVEPTVGRVSRVRILLVNALFLLYNHFFLTVIRSSQFGRWLAASNTSSAIFLETLQSTISHHMHDLWISYQIYIHGPASPELEFLNIQ